MTAWIQKARKEAHAHGQHQKLAEAFRHHLMCAASIRAADFPFFVPNLFSARWRFAAGNLCRQGFHIDVFYVQAQVRGSSSCRAHPALLGFVEARPLVFRRSSAELVLPFLGSSEVRGFLFRGPPQDRPVLFAPLYHPLPHIAGPQRRACKGNGFHPGADAYCRGHPAYTL